MVFTVIVDRERAWRNGYFEICDLIFGMAININYDTKLVTDFIRYVFKQLFDVFHPYRFAFIVDADIHFAALCISETADPFKVFVTPGFFVFNCLTFSHSVLLLLKLWVIHIVPHFS